MLAKLPLRSKLVLVVSVPLFVILGFATFGIAGRMSDLDAQRQYGRLHGPNDALAAVATGLENEGVLSTWAETAAGRLEVEGRLTRAREVDRPGGRPSSARPVRRSRRATRAPGRSTAGGRCSIACNGLDRLRTQVDDRGDVAFGATYTRPGRQHARGRGARRPRPPGTLVCRRACSVSSTSGASSSRARRGRHRPAVPRDGQARRARQLDRRDHVAGLVLREVRGLRDDGGTRGAPNGASRSAAGGPGPHATRAPICRARSRRPSRRAGGVLRRVARQAGLPRAWRRSRCSR